MTRLTVRHGVGAVALTLIASAATMPSGAAAPPKPAPDTPLFSKAANPGVAIDTSDGTEKFVLLRTGDSLKPKATILTSKAIGGPWKRHKNPLLTKAPAWANQKATGVWAPSLVRGDNGTWVVYYAALVKGESSRRCIGTGTAATSTGPFVPQKRPLSCWTGRPRDKVSGKAIKSLIDPSPARVGNDLVLLFKSGTGVGRLKGKAGWRTGTRMLKLNSKRPHLIGKNGANGKLASVQLFTRTAWQIEENPTIVLRQGTYTLFTSWGLYGGATYNTRYRQSKNLWNWTGKADRPKNLTFDTSITTYGHGNGQPLQLPGRGWYFFWNGHPEWRPTFPADGKARNGPQYLYAGTLTWSQGKPSVTPLVAPSTPL